MSCGEEIQKLGAEDDAERWDRKQEIGACRDPSRSVEAERATGNQAVKMIVTAESLIPGVKDGEKSDLAMQMPTAEIGQGSETALKRMEIMIFGFTRKTGFSSWGTVKTTWK